MKHCYDTEIARECGVIAAALLENIHSWVRKNAANERHFYDGRYWTYNSVKAFTALFPEFSARQIRFALDKLEQSGLILKGNYNNNPYDRTIWYALSDKAEAFYRGQDTPIDFTNLPNRKPDESESIINNYNQDDYTDKYPNKVPPVISPNNSYPTLSLSKSDKDKGDITSPIGGFSSTEAIRMLYNDLCPSLSKCCKLTEARKKALKARVQEGFTADDFSEAFRKAEASDFLKGKNSRGWRANFDFVTGPHFVDLLEGKYDNQTIDGSSTASAAPEYTDEEIDQLWRLEGEEEKE